MNSRTESPPTPSPAAAGRALSTGARLDDYEIEQVLAQGSLAVVYRAYDHALRLSVAIKEYMPDALVQRSGATQVVLRMRLNAQSFERGLQAFVGEAQTLARCEHPSLLRIDRVLQRNGTAYRVMRYCPGPTLLDHRRALARSPDAATLRSWFDALLGALEVLHADGWVHASVSPGNIVLLPNGRPLLMDFGAVRAAVIGSGTQDMLAALEPSFEPIEQREPAAGLKQGPWTDLYSLAATLRYCISGRLPALPGAEPAGSPPKDDWQSLLDDRSALADGLAAALEACLAEAPPDRPQSVAQVRALLDRRGAARHVPASAIGEAEAPTASAAPVVAPVSSTDAPIAAAAATAQTTPSLTVAAAAAPDATEPSSPPANEAATPDSAADAARAKVLADLEQTFALIDAQTNGDTSPTAPPRPAPPPMSPVTAPVTAPVAAPAIAPLNAPVIAPVVAPTLLPPSRRRWPVGVAALALVGLLVGAWLLLSRPDRDGVERLAGSASAVAALAPAEPAPAPAPAPSIAPAPLPSIAAAVTPEQPAAQSIAPAPVTATKAKSQATPAAGAATSRAAAPPTAGTTPGPRAQCAKRSGYARYQCMQTQCAKRSLVQHPECQRLRKTQRLD